MPCHFPLLVPLVLVNFPPPSTMCLLSLYTFRHLCGIVACTLLIFSKVLYFSVELLPGRSDFQFMADPGGTVSLIVLDVIIGNLCTSE